MCLRGRGLEDDGYDCGSTYLSVLVSNTLVVFWHSCSASGANSRLAVYLFVLALPFATLLFFGFFSGYEVLYVLYKFWLYDALNP